ncbi:hypothetical protein TanjilG_14880 [Lupinus angustifolius]|uniref:Hyccin n=2 Tax=Lupinus angustifolius TaxID=3871 RepID=A0A1J7G6Q5_LUPAN|nr:hypothetical protein TanjilG_14880 [Lupinus angustifolius]
MHSWWEQISKARSRIHSLINLLPSSSSSESLLSLADSDRPALSLLSSPTAYSSISSALSAPSSGSGSDPLCHWLYDTFLSDDPHLRLLLLSYLPLISGLYLSRVHHSSISITPPSLAGFEAVLLALYSSEVKSRSGKPLLFTLPDLSQPSIYHAPINKPFSSKPSVSIVSPSLEPQVAVKSTKRASIVGVAFDLFYKHISQMPSWSKIEFCQFASGWAGQDCSCNDQFDEIHVNGFGVGASESNEIQDFVQDMGNLEIEEFDKVKVEVEVSKGGRIPLPWEILQPVLRILGHCLLGPLNSQDVKDAASVAVRRLYARASHDLVPQGILATRSLIQLDRRARQAVKSAAAAVNASSNVNTPTKVKKPEVLLVSK